MDWLKTLASLAPTVATALGTPAAGMAVAVLEKALGLTGEDSVQSVIESGKLTGDQIAAIKTAELELQKQAQSLGLDFEKLGVEDRDSARKMQMATPSMWPGILSAVTTLAVLGVIGARMYGANLPDDPTTIQLIGSLTTGWGMCLAYWFGTTRSGSAKDYYLANSVPHQK